MVELIFARSEIIADLSDELDQVVNTFARKRKEGISYTELVLACTLMQIHYVEKTEDDKTEKDS